MKPLSLLLMLVMCGPAWADEISDLIQKLDDSNFLEREKAADRLEALGKKAIPALAQAATEGTLETAVRSIEILKKLMESEDKPTAGEAKSALEKLAQSEHAATARRAKNALNPPKPEPDPAVRPNRIPFGGILPVPAPRANNLRRVHTQINNGVKTIEVEEGNRKIKIEEDRNKGIQVEITETNNGKEATEKFEAKNEDELKKNHPKAHAEYEKYAKGNPVRIPFGGGAVPNRRPFNDNRLEMTTRLLESLGRLLDRTVQDDAIKDSSKESREALQKEIAEMKNRLGDLEQKLQAAETTEEKPKPQPAEKTPAEAEPKPEPAER